MNKEQGKTNYEETSVLIKQMLDIEVFPNLNQQVIMTTEDRLKICLINNLKKAEKRHDWIAPLGILISIIIVFVTSTFKDFIISSKTWEALFIICGFGSLMRLIISLRFAFVKIDIDKIIIEIKTNLKPNDNK